MKKFEIAVTSLLALLALSAAGCLFSFAYLSIQDLSRQSRLDKQAAFRLQEKEFQKLSAEHRDWQNLPDELRKFRREYIISMDDFAVLRRDLNDCLAANQLIAKNITSQFGSGKGKARKVAISFSLEGTYRNLKKFIYDMGKKPKMHFFGSIELNSSAALVKGKLNMEAYLGE